MWHAVTNDHWSWETNVGVMPRNCLFSVALAIGIMRAISSKIHSLLATAVYTFALEHILLVPKRWNRFCDPMKKKNWCDVAAMYSGNWLLIKNFSQTFVKNPFYFLWIRAYNRKLCVNKLISFFSYNTGWNVNKKKYTLTTKVNKRILLIVRS